jgi:hypothetical protein
MNLELLAICDAATASEGGKLNILGAFDSIWVQSLPAKHPQTAIAIRVRFGRSEAGNHRFAVRITTGGKVHTEMSGEIAIGVPEAAIDSAAINLILNVKDMEFRETGAYEIALYIDDVQAGRIPLHVRQHVARKQTLN